MSSTPRDARPGTGQLRIGAILIGLILAACQAATPLPSASGAGSVDESPSVSAVPMPSSSAVTTHWEQLGSMTTAPHGPRAVGFADGSVLVIGDDGSGELWDAGGTWRPIPGFDKPRTDFAVVRLQDGRAMVIGGLNDIEQSYLSALVFDPTAPDAGWVLGDGLLHTARTDPSAVVLADGQVLVTGGYFRQAPTYSIRPAGGTVLASSRGPLADVAPEIVGAALATSELFDPATGEWTATGPMTYARYDAPATLLSDGRVLVGASRCTNEVTLDQDACNSTEIYDPATGRFALTGSLPDMDWSGYDFPHDRDQVGSYPLSRTGSLVPLADGGAALMATYGGLKYGGAAGRSFRYDAGDGTWRQIGDLYLAYWNPIAPEPLPTPFVTLDVLPRLAPMVALLPDGRVLVAGGDGVSGPPATTPTAELYDPASDTWSSLPDMPDPRAGGAAVTLPDGSVLIAGGHRHDPSDPDTQGPLATAVRLVIGAD